VPADADELVATYPRLYHMAEPGSWERIRRHGLLSTSALLDLIEVDGDLRRALDSARRPASVSITHPRHGRPSYATRSRFATGRSQNAWSG
jgi:hypothetical protein